MPLARFRHSAGAAAPPGEVWGALQSAATWGGIGLIEAVWDEEHDEAGGLRSYRFRTSAAGRTWEGTASTVAAVPGERMEMTLSTREVSGRIEVTLTPEGEDSEVAVRLEVEPAGMLATLFWGVIREAIASGFERQVDHFAAGFGA